MKQSKSFKFVNKSINQKKHKMKKLFFIFLLGLSVSLASNTVFAQAEISHGFKQDIKVSTNKGGPVLIKQGEKKIIVFVPSSGTVNFTVEYKVGRRYVEGAIQRNIYDGKGFIPGAADANVETTTSSASSSADIPSVTKMQAPNPRQLPDDNFAPEVGKVNQIRNVTASIQSFNLKVKNEAKGKGDLIFMGNVFTGVAIPPTGDTITSREKVRPGLVELTALYKMPYAPGGAVSGQQFALAQQAFAFMVTDSNQVITITDNDFFDFSELTGNIKVRFKNVEKPVMLPKSGNKKLRPLRRGRISKAIPLDDVFSTMWYYTDENNVDHIAVFRITHPDRNNLLIYVGASDAIFNAGK